MFDKMKKFEKIVCVLCVISMFMAVVPVANFENAYASSVSNGKSVSIELQNDNGIYYENENVKFTVNFTASGTHKVDIENYFGTKLKTYWPSVTNTTYDLGKLDTGWYRIVFQNWSTGNAVSAAFAVVPNEDSRYSGETPFASDLAANAILKNTDLAEDYAVAAKKAGLGWVRERYSWWTKSNGEYDYSSFEEAVNKESEAGLNVIATSNDFARNGYTTQEQMFSDDLFKVYDYQKHMAAYFGDKVDAWEIWNEADNDNFTQVPADMYSTFYKAAAIAVKDSGADSSVMFSGLCLSADSSDYADMMLKNDILRYSDAYNIHRHLQMSSTPTQSFDTAFVSAHEYLMLENGVRRPIWITEAGLAASLTTNDAIKKQARYAVTSAVESLSAGTDKHFWFILPNFGENQKEYGVFDKNGQPNPAYASLAVVTKMLGKGEYKGKYKNSSVNGYVFNNGINDVLIAWVDNNTTPSINIGSGDKAYDFMGKEITGTVKASNDPIYVVFASELDTTAYTASPEKNVQTAEPLTAKDRIVIQAGFNGIENISDVRENGYIIGDKETRTVSLKLYNFNDTAVTGILRSSADGLTVAGDGVQVSVPGGEYITKTVTVTPDSTVNDQERYVSFWIETNDGDSSKTTAKLTVNESLIIRPENKEPNRAYSKTYKCNEQGLGFIFEEESSDVQSDNFDINLADYTSISGAAYSNGMLNINNVNGYATYEVYVSEDASYYIHSTMSASGTVFDVNGESVTRRCGRTKIDSTHWTMLDEVQLKAGQKNIIKVTGAVGTVSALTFEKLNNKQYTFAMNTFDNNKRYENSYFIDSYKDFGTGVGALDPWLAMNGTFAEYPEGDTAPFVVLNVTIPENGNYYPAVAKKSGGSNVMLTIDGNEIMVNENCTKEDEIFGVTNANGEWLRYNESIYLEAGTYPVRISLYLPSAHTQSNWNTNIGAIRLYKEEAPTVYSGNFDINLSNYVSINNATCSNGVVSIANPSGYATYEVYVSEDASYYIKSTMSASGTVFDVNGESVTRRCGRTRIDSTHWIMLDEVQLKAGQKNIIKVAGVTGTVSALSFIKLCAKQYTFAMNTFDNNKRYENSYFADSYKDFGSGVGALDPWLAMNGSLEEYPMGETAPYIVLDATIPESGYYYPAVAKGSGGSNVMLTIGDNEIMINENCTTEDEVFGVTNSDGEWLRYNESIYLEAGTYPVRLSLYLPADSDATQWNTNIGAFRFYEETEETDNTPWAEYDVEVSQTGAYSVRMLSALRMKLMINGTEVSYKTGRKVYDSNSGMYIYDYTAPLYKGKNTVRIEQMPNGETFEANTYLKEILLIKKDDSLKIGTTAKAMTDKSTNVQNLGFDPWAVINVDQEDAPYIKWTFEVPVTAKYNVELAYQGSAVPYINIGEYSVSFENEIKTGEYCLENNGLNKMAQWRRADTDAILLEKGIYEVKLSLEKGANAEKYVCSFAGFRLTEEERMTGKVWAYASKYGDSIKVTYDVLNEDEFDIIMVKYVNDNGIERMKKIYPIISANKTNGIDFMFIPLEDKKEDDLKIYIWDGLVGMKPLYESIGTKHTVRRLGN